MFSSDAAYGDLKDLTRRTASDKIFCDKALNIAKNSKYDGYQTGLVPMVFKFFDKKSVLLGDEFASGSGIKKENIWNQELAVELQNTIY